MYFLSLLATVCNPLYYIFRSRELQVFLDGIRRGQEQVLGDLSMILCDPYAINFLANSVVRLLQHLMSNEANPRVNIIYTLYCT